MFIALITPRVAKMVNGTESQPSAVGLIPNTGPMYSTRTPPQ